jgi:hypothetical protein
LRLRRFTSLLGAGLGVVVLVAVFLGVMFVSITTVNLFCNTFSAEIVASQVGEEVG